MFLAFSPSCSIRNVLGLKTAQSPRVAAKLSRSIMKRALSQCPLTERERGPGVATIPFCTAPPGTLVLQGAWNYLGGAAQRGGG